MKKMIGIVMLFFLCVPMVSADSLDITMLTSEDIQSIIDITAAGGNIDIIYNGVDLREQLYSNQQAIESFMMHTWYEQRYHDLLAEHEALAEAQWNFTNVRFTVTFNEITGIYGILGMYRLNERSLLSYTSGNTTILGEINKNTNRIDLLSAETTANVDEIHGILNLMEGSISKLEAADEQIRISIADTNSEVDTLQTELDKARQYFDEQFNQTQEQIRYMVIGFCIMLAVIIIAVYLTRPVATAA